MAKAESDTLLATPSASDLVLDEKKLSAAVASDQGDVFILQWLYKLEIALKHLEVPRIQQEQKQLEASLLKLVNPVKLIDGTAPSLSPQQQQEQSNPTYHGVPILGRPSRNIIARCFVILFDKGESRSLFDVLQVLMRTAGEEAKGKVIPEKEAKTGAFYIAGEIFFRHGHNVMSQFSDLTLLCQKVFKNTSSPVIVRYNALLCLSKVLRSGGRSLNEQPAKEMLKVLKQMLTDRAGAVSRGAVECLLAMLDLTSIISNRSEIEQISASCIRSLDTADFVTMRSLSRLTAILLAHTQKEGVQAPAIPIKKKKKRDGQEESSDDEAGPSIDSQLGTANRTIMTPKTMFDQLSLPFLRASTTRRGRGAILDVYATLLEQLGSAWVQTHYDVVLRHLIDDIPNHARGMSTRSEVLGIRTGVGIILRRVIGERMLGESAQVAAILEISNSFLKRYPVLMPGQTPPSKQTLTLALTETSGLLEQLGSAPPQVLDALLDSLLRCLSHPSHSVQISAAWCLRILCLYNPLQITGVIESVYTKLTRDIAALNGAGERSGIDLPRRTNGHARGLAALISVISQRPLYTSFDISNKVLEMSIELLKCSAEHSLAISAVEIQVAWVLIGSLMSLGPNFARSHLNQLLNMWRSALPKPSDLNGQGASRSEVEWGFLLHVRECTLGSIYSFLLHNGGALVTLDTAKKIITLLSNSLSFVNGFSSIHPHLAQEQIPGAERTSLTLLDREHMVRRRVFQCFSKLTSNPALEPLQEGLISASIQNFAEPDRYVGSAAQAAIAASAGTFTNIWSMSDGYAFGVTSLQRDAECLVSLNNNISGKPSLQTDWLNRDSIEADLDALQRRPITAAAEHDPLILYTTMSASSTPLPSLPPPPATAAVDASLEVFTALLPYQRRDVQISAFETLLEHSRSTKLERNPGRKMAVQVNACAAVLGTLRTAMQGGNRKYAAGFNNFRLTTALRELLKDALLHGDLALRRCASEAFGRLAAISGSHAMSSQVQFLVDQVVTNRDADARAGCALAFGAIYSEVGGLAAGPLTKTIVDILMSLANDPHPTVHFTALESLRMVVDAASLGYTAYVASTLGMLVKLYMLSTHEPEGGSAGSVNLRADLPAHQAIVRVISSLVGVLGPDLQESTKVRTLILILLLELAQEPEDGVVVEATKALQHFALFASQHLDLEAWIQSLRLQLKSSKRPLKVVAINSFYQLIQRHALMVSKIGGNALVEEFFAQLDGDAAPEGVRQVLLNWLRQTADLSPCGWIDLCQGIMSRVSITAPLQQQQQQKAQTFASNDRPGAPIGQLQDEEAAAIDLGDDSGSKGSNVQQSRWRTQLFALQCLHQVFDTVKRSGKLEHFDTPRESEGVIQMSSRVGDLIRMAFTASTAINSEIRLEGLTVLQDVIENFRCTRDPDFGEALLLEQHQAPIAAALTPAFTSDSTPEVLSRAVQVCAVFVGCGVVREVDKLGRILKLLTRALDNCSQTSMQSLGDVVDLSFNASAMLKIAVLTAWSGLQVASVEQPYLLEVMKPHMATLTPLWISSLVEFAGLRGDSDGSSFAVGGATSMMSITPMMDSPDAGLIRDILLPHYRTSWCTILHAVSVLLSQDDPFFRKAINGEALSNGNAAKNNRLAREPAVFFFALYGLAFESLLQSAGSAKDSQTSHVTLMALRYLTLEDYAGDALLQQDLFADLINLYYRVIMVETPAIQIKTIEAISEFTRRYGGQLLDADVEVGSLLPLQAKLARCLHLIIYALENVKTPPLITTRNVASDKSMLIRTCYSAMMDVMTSFPPTQREQILMLAFHSYSELLRDESSEIDLVGPTLTSLRELCIKSSQVAGDALQRGIHGFLSACVQTIDDMRARSGIIANNKIKNSMLAVIVVLTSLPRNFSLSQPVLEQYCFQLVQHLQASNKVDEKASDLETESMDIALTCINCLKTLVVATSRSSSASLLFCIGQLLPLLAEYLTNKAHDRVAAEDKTLLTVKEVLKTVSSLAGITNDENVRARLIGVILPIMILYLDEEDKNALPDSLSNSAVQQILSMASQQPKAFKQVVALLGSAEQRLVESKIRAAVGFNQELNKREIPMRPEARKIALKSFG